MSATVHPIIILLAVLFTATSVRADDDTVSFTKHIAPLLQTKCVACHGAKLSESDYRLDSYSAAISSGITAGNVAESEFYERLITDDADSRMPAESDPLTKQQTELVRRWIHQGAKFDGAAPDASLAEFIPSAAHPRPPKSYPAAIPISAIASDGKRIFVGGYHEITVWSMKGELLQRITDQGQRTYSIDLHPSKPWLLSASGTPGELGEVRLFDRDSGKLLRVISKASEVIMDARFSPDGSQIAIAMPDGSARVLDAKSFDETATLLGHSDAVTTVDWHKDGVRLATASRDASAKVFDVGKGQSIATFTGHVECVNDVTFIDEHQLISVSSDGTVQRWKIDRGRREQIVLDQKHIPVLSVSRSKTSYLVSGGTETHHYEIGSNRRIRRGDLPKDWVTASTILPTEGEATQFLLGTQTGQIQVWSSDQASDQTFAAIP